LPQGRALPSAAPGFVDDPMAPLHAVIASGMEGGAAESYDKLAGILAELDS
jgi:hypothetical protein